jgi:VIT1/CCC1 family predicted Fe2+/Mn2+ transporter
MLFRKHKKEHHGIQGMTLGMMDAIINVVGIIIGLSVMGNKLAVFVAILVAGIANSLGNAAGFHVSEETEGIHTRKEVWLSTIMTFVGTFFATMILLIPLIFLDLMGAVIISVSIGIVMLLLLGFIVSRCSQYDKKKTVKLMVEYLAMGIIVIIIAYYLGIFASGLVI